MLRDIEVKNKSNKFERFLNLLEIFGNKLPDITILFLIALVGENSYY